MKLNADWHAQHPMLPRATLEERARWHVAHAKHCGCRPIPATVKAFLGAGKTQSETVFDALWAVADRARDSRRLSSEDVAFVRNVAPTKLRSFPKLALPKTIRHPAGFSVSGAPVGTFLRSALLIAGERALGRRFGGAEFYESVEKDLALGIMRSHFHHGYPKGAHCCAQCTLAVYPTLEAGAIRYFDCRPLARDVRALITQGKWRFASPPHPKMLSWSLGGR